MHPLASTDEAPNLAIDSWVVNPAGGDCRKSFFLLLAACFWPSLAVARALRKRQILRHVLDAGNPPGPFFTRQRATVRAAPPGVRSTRPRPAWTSPLSASQMVVLQGKKRPAENRVQKRGERSSESDRRSATLSHLSRSALLPLSLCSSPARFTTGEWSRRDSNPRPSACKADALPAELRPQGQSFPIPIRSDGSPRGLPGQQSAVGARRFELRTSSLSATRSNQLSYAPPAT